MKKLFILSVFALTFFRLPAIAQEAVETNEQWSVRWQCVAMDSVKSPFWGKETFGRVFAEQSALTLCQGNSQSPDSCLVRKCLSDWECNSKACLQ